MDEKLLNRIIAVAYSDAGIVEKIRIYLLAKKNEEVKTTLAKYKQTVRQINSLELEECPEKIIKNSAVITKQSISKEKSIFFDLYTLIFGRPALASMVAGVFVFAIVSTFIFNRPEIKQQYSTQEIELADIQVKQSLAMIADIFNKTRRTIEKEILTEQVGVPVHKGFNLVNNLFIGENRYEKIN